MNILVVVYYWPPSAGSGVQRWLKMTKYLQELGHKVYVLTPENPDFDLKDVTLLKDVHPEVRVFKTRIWEPYRLARIFTGKKYTNTGTDHAKKSPGFFGKILRTVRARFFIPDPRKFWVNPSVRYLRKLIPSNGIDLVITSGPPHSLHKIGYKLVQKNADLRWIMDVRDPISQLDFFKDLGVEGSILKKYQKYEAKMLGKAHAVVGTSYSLPEYLETFDKEKYYTIPNGYDEDDFHLSSSDNSNTSIVISHAGLFNRYRYSEALWEALKILREEMMFSVKFAGPVSQDVLEDCKRVSGLEVGIENLGYISHDEVVKLYRESTVLLLFANKSEMGTTNVPGKIFELMASGKPILGFGNPGGDAARILKESGTGVIFSYEASATEIIEHLRKLIQRPEMKRNEEYIRKFSRLELAKEYADLCLSLKEAQ